MPVQLGVESLSSFTGIRNGQPAEYLCGEVNAKNSYGGYTGYRVFVLERVGRDSVELSLDGTDAFADNNLIQLVVKDSCTESRAPFSPGQWVFAGTGSETHWFNAGVQWQVDGGVLKAEAFVYFNAMARQSDAGKWGDTANACVAANCENKTVGLMDCISQPIPEKYKQQLTKPLPWREWGPVGNAADAICRTRVQTFEDLNRAFAAGVEDGRR